MSNARTATERICFVIAPIGEEETETRRRSDQVLRRVIEPAASECGYKVMRADRISQPGLIPIQVIHHLIDDPLVIADLTERNPNVYYELAIRHTIGKPIVQIIESGEKLPFDIESMRTIYFDHRSAESLDKCKNEITDQIRSIEKSGGKMDTPVSVAMETRPVGRKRSSLEILYENNKEPYCRKTTGRYQKRIRVRRQDISAPADTTTEEAVHYLIGPMSSVSMHYRLVKVKNVGGETARRCTVRITVSSDDKFSDPLIYGERVYPQWDITNAETGSDPQFFDLNPGEEQAITICHTEERRSDNLFFDDQGKMSNARRANSFKNGTYYLKVYAYSEDRAPSEADFMITKGEGYDNLEMKWIHGAGDPLS